MTRTGKALAAGLCSAALLAFTAAPAVSFTFPEPPIVGGPPLASGSPQGAVVYHCKVAGFGGGVVVLNPSRDVFTPNCVVPPPPV